MSSLMLDERGFVWVDGDKLPFRYLPETKQIEFFRKDVRNTKNKDDRIFTINLIDIQVLSLLYPPGENYANGWKCEKCDKIGLSNFKGIIQSENNIPTIMFECLHCGHTFAPLSHENTAQEQKYVTTTEG